MASFSRIVSNWTRALYHQILNGLESQNANQHGRGVISGCTLSDGGDLDVTVATGVIVTGATCTITGASFAVPDASTVYLWISPLTYDSDTDEWSAQSTTSASTADPGGDYVCLGRVTTVAGAITAITTEGRMDLNRWSAIRKFEVGQSTLVINTESGRVGIGVATPSVSLDVSGTTKQDVARVTNYIALDQAAGDPSAPTDQATIYAKADSTHTNIYFRDEDNVKQLTYRGSVYLDSPTVNGHQPTAVNIETLSGNKTLTLTDANYQRLTASGSNRRVIMPSSATHDKWFRIVNAGASNNILIYDPTNTTLWATLTPAQETNIMRPTGTSPAFIAPTTVAAEGTT